MSQLQTKIESILFVASKPLAAKKMSKSLNVSLEAVEQSLAALREKYNHPDSGIVLLQNNEEWQMVSSPDSREAAEEFLKSEVSGELTRPQLETLTVVSYCGPITKPELEQLRGVNCSLILRNLMIRGLIKETEDPTKLLPTYEVTMDYVRHLGLRSLSELPDYEKLHQHEFIVNSLNINPANNLPAS